MPELLSPSRLGRFKTWWTHAFAVDAGDEEFGPDEHRLARRLADMVVRRRMAAVAVMALESGRPLNFIGSQLLVFLAPFATFLFSSEEYERLTRVLEKRRGVDLFIDAITVRENEYERGDRRAHGDEHERGSESEPERESCHGG